MFPTTVIRGFIASPGDVAGEREAAVLTFLRWNAAQAESRRLFLEGVRWETHSRSQAQQPAQDWINSELLSKCDFLVGILGNRIGSPTAREISGTVEEIRKFRDDKGGDRVILFFSIADLPRSHDRRQLKKVEEFKKSIGEGALYLTYSSIDDFRIQLRDQLDMIITDVARSEELKQLWQEALLADERAAMVLQREREQAARQKATLDRIISPQRGY